MKASSGSTNEQRRYNQVEQLINYTQQMNEDHFYVVAGDFNIYSTNEPAYQKFDRVLILLMKFLFLQY